MGQKMKRLWVVYCGMLSFLTIEMLGAKSSREIFTLGATLPLSAEGKEIKAGIECAFNHGNQHNEFGNVELRLEAFDDQKKITNTLGAIRGIIGSLPVFADVYTTGAMFRLLPEIKKGALLVFGPEENNDLLYGKAYRYILHTKPPISCEIDALIEYAIHALHLHTFAIFYENNTLGLQGSVVAKRLIEQHGQEGPESYVRLLVSTHAPSGIIKIVDAVEEVAKYNPQAIICIGSHHVIYNFIIKALNKGLFNTTFLATSGLLPIQKPLFTGRGVNLVVATNRPNFNSKTLPLAQTFKRDFSHCFPKLAIESIAFDAYVHGRILDEIFKRISGEITIDQIVQQVESIKTPVNIEGFKILFDPALRTLSQQIWIVPGYNRPYIAWSREHENRHEHVTFKVEE